MGALNVFGSAPAGLTPFTEPERGDDFTLSEHEGRTLILTVVGEIQKETQKYGVKPAISCSKIVSLGDGEPLVYTDVLIFQAAPVGQLRASAGQTVVAKVVSYVSSYKNTAYKMDAPDAAGYALAEAYMKAEG